MYGTIARLHPKPDRVDELLADWHDWDSTAGPMPDGYVASYLVSPDQNPYDRPTVFLVAIFRDRESYVANANSPEQGVRYERMRALLAEDPVWSDGTFLGG